uniref:Uncharacterized protein n=1 Tax=Rhizophora mucronata TaxID=61149 RepID=A0A2P2PSQ5_RHIMU
MLCRRSIWGQTEGYCSCLLFDGVTCMPYLRILLGMSI